MGSDTPPHLLFDAVLQAADKLGSAFSLLVFATQDVIDQVSRVPPLHPQSNKAGIQFKEVFEEVSMTDDPSSIRHKKTSSIMIGMDLLKKRELDAFVSCGNTGALVAGAVLSLPKLPGITRPALLASLPTEKGLMVVLDVGSTILHKERYLIQFAFLGAAYQRVLNGKDNPSVGLLNVGIESKKGTIEIGQAFDFLSSYVEDRISKRLSPGMNFVGNIEARDVFKGNIDVLVTDGFTGNVLLKTAEGVSSFIFEAAEKSLEGCSSGFQSSLCNLKKQFNYAEYPGAIVCGVEGLVIKVHGTGISRALYSSIMGAADASQKDVIAKLKAQLSEMQRQ